MKWGFRRYQNKDGSLTPLGRVHYGYGKAKEKGKAVAKTAGEAAGTAAKVVGRAVVRRIKAKHPWMMNDDELKQLTDRYNAESALKQARTRAKGESMMKKTLGAAGDILYTGSKQLVENAARNAGQELGKRMVKSALEKEAEDYDRKYKVLKNKHDVELAEKGIFRDEGGKKKKKGKGDGDQDNTQDSSEDSKPEKSEDSKESESKTSTKARKDVEADIRRSEKAEADRAWKEYDKRREEKARHDDYWRAIAEANEEEYQREKRARAKKYGPEAVVPYDFSSGRSPMEEKMLEIKRRRARPRY